ncbi:DUF6883 domain-containing protein [Microcoleus sp. B5-C4]|uniref:DUF6883 domain-containing protein n=1 Tax=Microcoleus sp. B5-C4 TaxID=2818675 RepID=UPI002FD3EF07
MLGAKIRVMSTNMNLKKNVSHIVIATRKLTEYPLNLDSALDSDKAVIFQPRLGLNQ